MSYLFKLYSYPHIRTYHSVKIIIMLTLVLNINFSATLNISATPLSLPVFSRTSVLLTKQLFLIPVPSNKQAWQAKQKKEEKQQLARSARKKKRVPKLRL